MDGQNGLQCRKYITVTVAAIDFDAANSAIHAIETQLISCLANIGTTPVALNANERVRLMADILCDVNKEIAPCSQSEMSRQAEKYLCCPDYFEFKNDYFLFNDKYARCVFFKRFGTSINDDIYKRLIELNQTMVISQNVDFVESDAAIELVQRKLTDMHQEEISKVRKSTEATNGTFINTMQGSDLQRDQEEALQLLEDLRGNCCDDTVHYQRRKCSILPAAGVQPERYIQKMRSDRSLWEERTGSSAIHPKVSDAVQSCTPSFPLHRRTDLIPKCI